MIVINFDKESEFQWLKAVLAQGVLNADDTMKGFFQQLNINPEQTVTYRATDDYENDIEEEIEKYNSTDNTEEN